MLDTEHVHILLLAANFMQSTTKIHDAAAMYQAAAQASNHFSINDPGNKAAKYAAWKLLVFQGYMYAFTGLLNRHSAYLLSTYCLSQVPVRGAHIANSYAARRPVA